MICMKWWQKKNVRQAATEIDPGETVDENFLESVHLVQEEAPATEKLPAGQIVQLDDSRK